jgi:tetratricopeptide (TPR) repeat protein
MNILIRGAWCLVVLLAGCAVVPDTRVTEIKQQMGMREAATELKSLRGYSICNGTSIAASCNGKIDSVEVHADVLIVNGHMRIDFATMVAPLISYANFDSAPTYVAIRPGVWIWTGLGPKANNMAERVANAMLVLKRSADPETRRQDDANFARTVQSYREAPVKPVPGEDVRQYKVQAEAAVREKNFEDAEDLYGTALRIAPWWPAGHFNRAILLAETADFESAALEMKRYLALAPDASDARAAQDKIYEWQRKAESMRP